MQSVQEKIVEKLQLLPEADRASGAKLYRIFSTGGNNNHSLWVFQVASYYVLHRTIAREELELMAQAIEADCGFFDLDEW